MEELVLLVSFMFFTSVYVYFTNSKKTDLVLSKIEELSLNYSKMLKTNAKTCCPVCKKSVPSDEIDHRNCVITLFRENKIQNIKDFEKLSVVKKTIKVPKTT